jgi:hemerythrin-like domain-containing protein
MPNAFEVLAEDHQEVLRMLAELELGPTAAAGANPDQLALRQKLVEQLVIEESKHEAVEERYFWPAVRSHLSDGDDLANQAQDQEQQAKFILDRLDKVSSPEHEEFEAQITHFITVGRAHVEFEETVVWPGLRTALTAQEADDLGRELAQAKETASSHPHPNTPPVPGLLKIADAAEAAVSALRDAVTGRGDE